MVAIYPRSEGGSRRNNHHVYGRKIDELRLAESARDRPGRPLPSAARPSISTREAMAEPQPIGRVVQRRWWPRRLGFEEEAQRRVESPSDGGCVTRSGPSARRRSGAWASGRGQGARKLRESVDHEPIRCPARDGEARPLERRRRRASPRSVRPAAHGFRVSQTRAARAIRRRLVALIAIAATSRSARALTSTKAMESPRRAMRSISPPETTNRRARIV